MEPVQILSDDSQELLSHLAAIALGLSWGCRTALGDPEQAPEASSLYLGSSHCPGTWGA